MENQKATRKVSKRNLYFTVMLAMMEIEINYTLPVSDKMRREWFYDSEKDSKYLESSYSISAGRDEKAWGRTETFRKTFLKHDFHTPEFLALITRKFKLFPSFTSWEKFVEYVRTFLILLCSAEPRPEGYTAEQLLDYYEGISETEQYEVAHRFALNFVVMEFQLMVVEGKVLLPDSGLPVASTAHNGIFFKGKRDAYKIFHSLREVDGDKTEILRYDREHIIKKNPDIFFLLYAPDGIITAVEVIPLNNLGLRNLQTKYFFTWPLTDEMICSPDSNEEVQAFYLNVASDIAKSEALAYFGLHISNIVRFILKSAGPCNVPVIMSNDTKIKRDLIARFNLHPFKSGYPVISMSKAKIVNKRLIGARFIDYRLHVIPAIDFIDPDLY